MAGLAKALTKMPRKPYRSKATAQKEAGIGTKPKSPLVTAAERLAHMPRAGAATAARKGPKERLAQRRP